jgi:hypothetical protein
MAEIPPPKDKEKPKKSNVVTGIKALGCCKNAERNVELTTLKIVNDMLRQAAQHVLVPKESWQDLYLQLPGAGFSTTPTGPIVEFHEFRTIAVPKGSPAPAPVPKTQGQGGAVLLLAAETYANYKELEAGIDTLTEVSNMMDRVRTQTKDKAVFDCEECIRKALLSQSNKRQYTEERVRKRI